MAINLIAYCLCNKENIKRHNYNVKFNNCVYFVITMRQQLYRGNEYYLGIDLHEVLDMIYKLRIMFCRLIGN